MLTLSINVLFIHTVFFTFHMVLTRRICLTITAFNFFGSVMIFRILITFMVDSAMML